MVEKTSLTTSLFTDMKHKGIEAFVCYGFICFEYKHPKDIRERILATSMLLFMIYETFL